jgi:arylformamidase
MTQRIIDISVRLHPQIPVWPDSAGFHTMSTMALDKGDTANVTRLDCDVHVGTHIDAPRHFLKNGKTVDELSLDILIGPAVVVFLPRTRLITAAVLEKLPIPPHTRRLLLHTRNSRMWAEPQFNSDYTALAPDAAQWIVDRHIGLVGIDYLSVEQFGTPPDAHTILLAADIVILEGLNLTDAAAGTYELICLPLRLAGAEGAPARAILRQLH